MNDITQFTAFKYCDSLKTLMSKFAGISFSKINGRQRKYGNVLSA